MFLFSNCSTATWNVRWSLISFFSVGEAVAVVHSPECTLLSYDRGRLPIAAVWKKEYIYHKWDMDGWQRKGCSRGQPLILLLTDGQRNDDDGDDWPLREGRPAPLTERSVTFWGCAESSTYCYALLTHCCIACFVVEGIRG